MKIAGQSPPHQTGAASIKFLSALILSALHSLRCFPAIDCNQRLPFSLDKTCNTIKCLFALDLGMTFPPVAGDLVQGSARRITSPRCWCDRLQSSNHLQTFGGSWSYRPPLCAWRWEERLTTTCGPELDPPAEWHLRDPHGINWKPLLYRQSRAEA